MSTSSASNAGIRLNQVGPSVKQALLAAAVASVLLAGPARAADATVQQYQIAAQPLADALRAFAKQSGLQLTFSEAETAGERSESIEGSLAAKDALAQMLRNTSLRAQFTDGSTVVVKKDNIAEIIVTGKAYAGGQVGKGGSLGMLGNVTYMESAFSQTSYTSELVKNLQSVTMSQVLESAPSVRRTNGRFSSNDDVTIRGFSVTTSDTSYAGVFGLGTFRRVPLEGVDRVELLKGPSALLNGVPPEGGVGGSVNLVPKRATSLPVTDLTVSHVSDSYFSGHLDMGRRFGAEEQFGARVNVAYGDGDTPLDNNNERMKVGNLALDYVGDDLRLYAHINYDYHIQHASIFSGLSIAPGIAVPDAPKSSNNPTAPFTQARMERRTNLLSAEYDFSDNWEGRISYGWQRSEELQYIHFGSRFINAAGDYTGPNFYRLRTGDYDYDTADVKLFGRFETGPVSHRIAIAGYWLERTFDNYTQNVSIPAASVGIFNINDPDVFRYPVPNFNGVARPRFQSETIQDGYAISDTLIAFDDRLRLTLGVREQRIKNETNGIVVYDKSRLTPAGAVSYRLRDSLAIYGNYIQGLSQPPSPPSTAVNALEVFPPAKSEQIEVGAKLDLGEFGATLALFEITRPSGITDPLTNVFSLDGEQRNRGVELEGFGMIAPGVRVLGGLAYLEPILTNTQNGINEGNNAPSVPEWRINVSGEWDVPFIPGLTLIGQALYTDKAYQDAPNLISVPSWTRLDLGARYGFSIADRPITMRLRISNLLDEDYWETSGFVTGEPRTFSMSLAVNFL